MKNLRNIILVVAASGPLIGLSALGEPADTSAQRDQKQKRTEDYNPNPNSTRNSNPNASVEARWQSTPERLGALDRSSKIIGATVKDSAGEKIGKIRDLAVDLRSGRVLEVILATGGVLGVGERLTAVPPSTVSTDGAGNLTAATLDKEKLKNSPEFEFEKWTDATHPSRIHSTYTYYSVEPRYLHDDRLNHDTTTRRDTTSPNVTTTTVYSRDGSHLIGHVERASKIVGQQVTNEAGDKVGKVDDLLVDLAAGRIAEVIVSSGGFLGVGDELSGIPPSVFRYDMANGKLALHVDRETLNRAPRFKDSDWSSYTMPNRVTEVYTAYGVQPYYDSSTPADNTARNVRDRNDRNLTPIDQGNNEADVKSTAEIRRSISKESGFSVNARNVKIITVNGRVTLRGPVNSASEKERIEEIAHRVAGVDMVDSQIEVKAESPK